MTYEKEKRYVIGFNDVPAQRQSIPALPVEERKGNFVEVETGFTKEQAQMEARRCLSCRRCLGCALCWAECKPEAINFELPDVSYSLEFDEVVVTPGQENGFQNIDSALGYGTFSNVMTDLQFENMLAPSGPTGGMVLSPLSGDLPAKIVFVQSRPKGGDQHLLSSLYLAANEALLARRSAPGVLSVIISPPAVLLQPDERARIGEMDGLSLIESEPVAVKEDGEGARLKVLFRDKDPEAAITDVDLVVVLTQPRVSKELQSLSEKVGQEVKYA